MLKQGREKPADERPYIRDVSLEPEGAAGKATLTIGFVTFAIAIGFVVGFAVYLLMNLSTWLTGQLWDGLGGSLGFALFPLFVCTIGGLLIGLWTRFSGNRIQPLEVVMHEFKTTGRYELHGAGKSVVSFLLPLVFGGSVGFEAGLTGIITAACCWIRDKLKEAGLRAGAVADVTIAATISAIFGAPLAGIVAGADSDHVGERGEGGRAVDAYNMRRRVKLVLYTAAAFGAFGGIALFTGIFGGSGGLPRFDAITATYADLLWVVPCILLAWLMVLLYHASNSFFGDISRRLGEGPTATIVKPVVAGLVMGVVALAFPLALFPGEEQSRLLMESWEAWTVLMLLGTGLFKCILTPMCIRMGWMGGNFFPSIFAGVACGYGLAALTGADPMLMVTVTATAYLAGVTRQPLLTVAILALCFPLAGILWSGLAAVIGGTLPVPRTWLQEDE